MASKRLKKKRWKANGGILHCTLCGKLLWAHGENFVAGKSGTVCYACLNTGHALAHAWEAEKRASRASGRDGKACTPQALVESLDKRIAGQTEAKRAVALAVWKQQRRAKGEKIPSGHLLLYGPTGCGKTYLATQAAKLAGLPYHVFDATTLTEAGYSGRDAADILRDYAKRTEGKAKRKYGVIILDEADKLSARGGAERQTYRRATQGCLLKLLEGVEAEGIDSSNLLFILCGAFTGIGEEKHSRPIGFDRTEEEAVPAELNTDAFVRYGMERELMGRVTCRAPIRALQEEDLLRILTEKEDSVLRSYQAYFESHGLQLKLPEETAHKLIKQALAMGTGARALRSELDKLMEPLLYRLAAGELEGEVLIDA